MDQKALLKELAKVKVIFQQRTIAAIMTEKPATPPQDSKGSDT